jgi:hypothetical protein
LKRSQFAITASPLIGISNASKVENQKMQVQATIRMYSERQLVAAKVKLGLLENKAITDAVLILVYSNTISNL